LRLFDTNISLVLVLQFLFVSAYADAVFEGVLTIPFTKSNGLMLVEAEVEGQAGYFIFDTGADALLLNSTHYPQLSVAQKDFQTLTGTMPTQASQVETFKMGKLQLSDIPAFGTDLNNLELQTILPISGIIGANLFSADFIEIDNEDQVIRCYANDAFLDVSKKKVSAKIIVEQGMTLVPIKIEGKYYNFCLDTGASVSLIDAELMKQMNSSSNSELIFLNWMNYLFLI